MANRLIAVSLKARGLVVYENRPGQAKAFLTESLHDITDISIAIATDVVLASASTWISVILTILSTIFYCFYRNGLLARDGSILIPIALLIYLPTLYLAHLANQRRLEAARLLSQVQSQVLGMYVLHSGLCGCGTPQLLTQLDDNISDTMAQLQGYLAHPRPLASRHFSLASLRGGNLPLNSELFLLGRDIGQRLRQLQACLRRLSATAAALLEATSSHPAHQQQALSLLQLLVPLTGSVQGLMTAKDLHSPLLLRAVLRPGCVLLAPLLSGCWLAGVAGGAAGGAAGIVFALVVGIMLQVLLMTFHTLGLLLEDPFDTGPAAPPDTLSLLEFNHTLGYLTAPPGTGNEDDTAAAAAAGEVQVSLQQQQPQQQQQYSKYGHNRAMGSSSFSAGGGEPAGAQQQQQQQQHAGDDAAAAAADGGGRSVAGATAARAVSAEEGGGSAYQYEY